MKIDASASQIITSANKDINNSIVGDRIEGHVVKIEGNQVDLVQEDGTKVSIKVTTSDLEKIKLGQPLTVQVSIKLDETIKPDSMHSNGVTIKTDTNEILSTAKNLGQVTQKLPEDILNLSSSVMTILSNLSNIKPYENFNNSTNIQTNSLNQLIQAEEIKNTEISDLINNIANNKYKISDNLTKISDKIINVESEKFLLNLSNDLMKSEMVMKEAISENQGLNIVHTINEDIPKSIEQESLLKIINDIQTQVKNSLDELKTMEGAQIKIENMSTLEKSAGNLDDLQVLNNMSQIETSKDVENTEVSKVAENLELQINAGNMNNISEEIINLNSKGMITPESTLEKSMIDKLVMQAIVIITKDLGLPVSVQNKYLKMMDIFTKSIQALDSAIKAFDTNHQTIEKAQATIKSAMSNLLFKMNGINTNNQKIDPERFILELKMKLDIINDHAKLLNVKQQADIKITINDTEKLTQLVNKVPANNLYLQMPIFMNEGSITGDLFIMKKRKQKAKKHKNTYSVYIALHTENLGLIGSFIQSSGNNLSIKFMVQEDELIPYVNKNHFELKEALAEKGFNLTQFSVKKLKEVINIKNIENFVTKENQSDNIVDIKL